MSNGYYILQNPSGVFYSFGGQFYGYSKAIADKLVKEMNETKAENEKIKNENERLKKLLKSVNAKDNPELVKMIMEL